MMEMESFLKEFGVQLKTTRKAMGLSQVNAAQQMRIDYRHYQNIEGGKINLRLDTLMKLVKFYNLDKKSRPVNVDVCLDLLSGYRDADANDNWNLIYHHFVDGGHAGFISFNVRTKTVDQINRKLFGTLGYRSASDLIGKPANYLMISESSTQFENMIRHHAAEQVSKPFIVTFRTQPPAFPIPMMAVVKAKRDSVTGDEHLHGIFFDRKTLEEEGHRLKEILNGYQQFMELYPQLKAV
jgi:transcriptional regulator with XRE-family HTH domain